jgi:diguanylate cyclase (GGDEF)-like protein/PAS domain S-box-containing protein
LSRIGVSLINMSVRDWVFLGLILLAAGLGAVLLIWRRRLAKGGLPEARRQWARRLADASFDGLLIHRNGIILQMNTALVRMLGYRETEMLGTPFFSLTHPALMAALRTELEAPQPQVTPFTLLHADKSDCAVEMASHTLEFNGLPATVTAIRNLTPLRQLEERLDHMAHNDSLTSLPNRQQFTKMLQHAIHANDRGGGTTVVLVLEVDRLLAINDVFGRGGGDALLRQIAARLTNFKHESDVVGRLDGNKFGMIQPHTGAPNRNSSLISQIEQSFDEPFIVDGRAVTASMSIGISIYPEHATDAEGLLWASDLAMGRVLRAGGGGSRMFSHADAQAAGLSKAVVQANLSAAGTVPANIKGDDFRGTMRATQLLGQELRDAIVRNEVTLDYQPFFAAKNLSLAGVEAFSRWWHPRQGPMPPGEFVALADTVGLTEMLGNFILESACVEAMRCKAPLISVNLSPLQFQDLDLPARIREILRKTGMPADRLELQVTEAVLNLAPQQSLQQLQALRALGVSIVLDDFGTGLSSLTCLADFQFNKIKIEKRMIHALGEDASASAIIGGILALARNFGIEVVAEGVETEAQLKYLQDQGCQFVQGYLLGRPTAQAANFSAAQAGGAAAQGANGGPAAQAASFNPAQAASFNPAQAASFNPAARATDYAGLQPAGKPNLMVTQR